MSKPILDIINNTLMIIDENNIKEDKNLGILWTTIKQQISVLEQQIDLYKNVINIEILSCNFLIKGIHSCFDDKNKYISLILLKIYLIYLRMNLMKKDITVDSNNIVTLFNHIAVNKNISTKDELETEKKRIKLLLDEIFITQNLPFRWRNCHQYLSSKKIEIDLVCQYSGKDKERTEETTEKKKKSKGCNCKAELKIVFDVKGCEISNCNLNHSDHKH